MDFEIKEGESLKIETQEKLIEAGKERRLANYLIDLFCIYIFGYLIGGLLGSFADIPFVFSFIEWISNAGSVGEYILGFALMLIYYPFFEYMFGFTPGKIVTRTKVVTERGNKPGFINILGRTCCRFIPFDALSFLASSTGKWHDSISKTKVVSDTGERKLLIPVLIISFLFLVGGIFFVMTEAPINSYEDKPDSDIINFSYNGINFNHTENWKVEKEVIEQDFSYQINCQKRGTNNMENLSITFIYAEMDLDEWMKATIEEIRKQPVFKDAVIEKIEHIQFTGYDAVSVKFAGKIFSENYYAQCIAFYDMGISVLYLKQAETPERLAKDFKVIENSLMIN